MLNLYIATEIVASGFIAPGIRPPATLAHPCASQVGQRSAGTGVYTEVCRYAAPDSEHRTHPHQSRAVDLWRYV